MRIGRERGRVQDGGRTEQRVRQIHVRRLIHNVLKLARTAQIVQVVHDRTASQLMQLSKLSLLFGVGEFDDDARRGALFPKRSPINDLLSPLKLVIFKLRLL